MATPTLLVVSIILQLVAAFLALRLIPVTQRRSAWTLVALAFSLMALRRGITLSRVISGGVVAADPSAEITALLISLLLVIGVALIGPVFAQTRRIRDALERRAAQQATVAELGRLALRGTKVASLFDSATESVARCMGARYAQVLELLPDGNTMLLRSGVGWKPDLVGHATIPADMTSQAGYTLSSMSPVVVEDTDTESLVLPPLLRDHGVRSGMSVVIGDVARPFGILGVHAEEPRRFARDDISFLQAVANVLAEAIERQAAHEAYQTLVDNSLQGLAILQGGRLVFVNPALSQITGYSAEELLAMAPEKVLRLVPEEERAIITTRVRDQLAGKAVTPRIEHRLVSKDGAPHWVEAQVTRISYGGKPAVQIAYVEVTERRQAEQEVRLLNTELEGRVQQRTAELQVAMGELESFSYSVSHDLQAPLRAIDGYSKALVEDYADLLDDAGKGSLQRIRVAARRMGELIDALLLLFRTARAPLSPRPVDLSTLARVLVEELQHTASKQDVELVVRDGIEVFGDPDLLRIALHALLSNAIRFSRPGEQARIELGTTDANGTVAYFVRDAGIGFDMSYGNKLFRPFQRLHSEDALAGVGIGLAVFERVIRRHRGRVWAEAAVGGGATFYFTLGLHPGEAT